MGLQAQIPAAPYVGLHTRLAQLDPASVGDGLVDRSLVRIALMRSTVHLVSARDCLAIRPVIAGVLDRQLWRGSPWGTRIEGIDVAALVHAGRAILDEAPRTGPELGRALHERFSRYDGEPLANAIRNLVPLVQLPPRGVWGAAGVPGSRPPRRGSGRRSPPMRALPRSSAATSRRSAPPRSPTRRPGRG